MNGFFSTLLLLAICGTAAWFVLPAVMDTLKLKRQNLRIIAVTRQTKRDMTKLARRRRQNGGR